MNQLLLLQATRAGGFSSTHAYVLWAANELLAVFAPAFPLSLLRQETRPQPAQAHSLGRWVQSVKKKENCDNFS